MDLKLGSIERERSWVTRGRTMSVFILSTVTFTIESQGVVPTEIVVKHPTKYIN